MFTNVEFIEGLTSRSSQFPSQEDLTGAAVALLRLQDTYALSTTHLAQGNLAGVTDSSVMTGLCKPSCSIILSYLLCKYISCEPIYHKSYIVQNFPLPSLAHRTVHT